MTWRRGGKITAMVLVILLSLLSYRALPRAFGCVMLFDEQAVD